MNWNTFLNDTIQRMGTFQAEAPETFSGFNIMGKAAKKNGALDEKPKNLLRLA